MAPAAVAGMVVTGAAVAGAAEDAAGTDTGVLEILMRVIAPVITILSAESCSIVAGFVLENVQVFAYQYFSVPE